MKRTVFARAAIALAIVAGAMVVASPAAATPAHAATATHAQAATAAHSDAATVSRAAAVTCSGDSCSGKDPMATGCAADARTIFTNYVYGTYGKSWVDVRWSDACQTNWARTNNMVLPTNVKAIQDTGYTAGYSNNNGTVSWSGMIYSPVHHVQACIWGGWGTTCTSWA